MFNKFFCRLKTATKINLSKVYCVINKNIEFYKSKNPDIKGRLYTKLVTPFINDLNDVKREFNDCKVFTSSYLDKCAQYSVFGVKLDFKRFYLFIKTEINDELNAIYSDLTYTTVALIKEISDELNAMKEDFVYTTSALLNEISDELNAMKEDFVYTTSALLNEVYDELRAIHSDFTYTKVAFLNEVYDELRAIHSDFTYTKVAFLNEVYDELRAIHSDFTYTKVAFLNEVYDELNAINEDFIYTKTALFNQVSDEFNTVRSEFEHTYGFIKTSITPIWLTINAKLVRFSLDKKLNSLINFFKKNFKPVLLYYLTLLLLLGTLSTILTLGLLLTHINIVITFGALLSVYCVITAAYMMTVTTNFGVVFKNYVKSIVNTYL